MHCARRKIEKAWAHQGGKLHILALDWRKAFDSINTEALLNGLTRFGVPANVLQVIKSIYTDRSFMVKESGVLSMSYRQESGICQGCPLSPFLFIIVMTILMQDARALLSPKARAALEDGSLSELLYADDTLVMGESASLVSEYGAAIEQAGAAYGMSLHWGKTQAMSVCTKDRIRRPDGSIIEKTGSLEYLGALLTADGRVDSEISRRIGVATGDFRRLQQLWNHAGLAVREKLHFFDSLIVSRLKYGLGTICLVTSQRRRLDGFYARCLRKILTIPAAFISRVSNASVYGQAGVSCFSMQLVRQQVALLRRVARAPPGPPFAHQHLCRKLAAATRRKL